MDPIISTPQARAATDRVGGARHLGRFPRGEGEVQVFLNGPSDVLVFKRSSASGSQIISFAKAELRDLAVAINSAVIRVHGLSAESEVGQAEALVQPGDN